MKMEEGHNQLKISPKEMMEKGGEDQISALPDCLIIEILCHLPSTKEAVRTGTLSKRWKDVWTWVHTLTFTYSEDFVSKRHKIPKSKSDFISSVDKTLTQCHQLKLKKFQVYLNYDDRFESQFKNWIRYAISRDIEDLNLKLLNLGDWFSLNQSFFVNTGFSDLTLSRCILKPNGVISWKKFKRLCISWMDLDEDLIENILSGSPLPETMVLEECYGYRRLDITSKSVKNLVLDDYYRPWPTDYIEIIAPNILSLTIKGDMWFSKLSLLNVPCVIKANLDCYTLGYGETTHEEEMLNLHLCTIV